ncbi:MAG: helix-turn-helix transcriptional regulator [Nitrospirota bacterium]
MPKEKSHIGHIIRNARRASGLSQMQLAEKVGLSYQQIQKYEKGASEITVKRLYQIAEALEIPVNTFLQEKNLAISESSSFYGSLSDEEETLLRLYREIKSSKIKNMILTAVKAISEQKE